MKDINSKLRTWTEKHYLNLAIFNFMLIILVLLRVARYFDPYWLISINTITIIAMVSSIFLLGARYKTFLVLTLIFLFFSGVMKLLGTDIWAERVSIYAFQSLTIAAILMIIESITNSN